MGVIVSTVKVDSILLIDVADTAKERTTVGVGMTVCCIFCRFCLHEENAETSIGRGANIRDATTLDSVVDSSLLSSAAETLREKSMRL